MLTSGWQQKKRRNTNVVLFLALVFFLLGSIWWWRSHLDAESGLRLLFLAEDPQGVVQLFQSGVEDTAVSQLTTMRDPVTGYAFSPKGAQIAFTTSEIGLGQETIWLLAGGRAPQPLLTCANAVCHNLVWSPDGRRLMYERHDLDETGIPGWPRLWWLDLASKATEPALATDRPGAAARFSPDGQWLAYYSPPDEGVWVYHFTDGRAHFVISEPGAPVAWHPNGQGFLYTAFNFVDWQVQEDEHADEEHRHANLTSHLFYFDLSTATSTQISPAVVLDDSVPAWSPDGQWIAFGRRQVRTNASRQVWLMSAEGHNPVALTDDVALNAGPPQWSVDGRFLLFQRFNQELPNALPGIWLLEIASGQLLELAYPGYFPSFQS